MRQVGIIVGPLTIFWTKNWRFSLLGIPVDKFNSATLLIAILWMIVLAVNLAATHFEPKPISSKEKALESQRLGAKFLRIYLSKVSVNPKFLTIYLPKVLCALLKARKLS